MSCWCGVAEAIRPQLRGALWSVSCSRRFYGSRKPGWIMMISFGPARRGHETREMAGEAPPAPVIIDPVKPGIGRHRAAQQQPPERTGRAGNRRPLESARAPHFLQQFRQRRSRACRTQQARRGMFRRGGRPPAARMPGKLLHMQMAVQMIGRLAETGAEGGDLRLNFHPDVRRTDTPGVCPAQQFRKRAKPAAARRQRTRRTASGAPSSVNTRCSPSIQAGAQCRQIRRQRRNMPGLRQYDTDGGNTPGTRQGQNGVASFSTQAKIIGADDHRYSRMISAASCAPSRHSSGPVRRESAPGVGFA